LTLTNERVAIYTTNEFIAPAL